MAGNSNSGRRPLPRLTRSSVEYPIEAESCPRWLDAAAKKEWRRVVPLLTAAGVVSRISSQELAAYCQAVSRMHDAEAKVVEFGTVLVSSEGKMYKSPYLRIVQEERAAMLAFAREFGMTPSSATRVNAVRQADEDDGVATRPRIATGTGC